MIAPSPLRPTDLASPPQYVVVTVSLKAGLEMQAWTWLTHLAIWGSIVVWFAFLLIYSQLPFAHDMIGLDTMLFSSPVFWLGLIMVPTTTILPDVVYKRCAHSAWMRRDNLADGGGRMRRDNLADGGGAGDGENTEGECRRTKDV